MFTLSVVVSLFERVGDKTRRVQLRGGGHDGGQGAQEEEEEVSRCTLVLCCDVTSHLLIRNLFSARKTDSWKDLNKSKVSFDFVQRIIQTRLKLYDVRQVQSL